MGYSVCVSHHIPHPFDLAPRHLRVGRPELLAKMSAQFTDETDAKIKAAMALENCQSQNEFVEKALRFYSDYLVAGDYKKRPASADRF